MTFYLASTNGTFRELTFDECELLNLDGTQRGVRQHQTMTDVVVYGPLVVTVMSTGDTHTVAAITFTPLASNAGYVGAPAYIARCEGGPVPFDVEQPFCDPFWDAVHEYLDNDGGIEWTS